MIILLLSICGLLFVYLVLSGRVRALEDRQRNLTTALNLLDRDGTTKWIEQTRLETKNTVRAVTIGVEKMLDSIDDLKEESQQLSNRLDVIEDLMSSPDEGVDSPPMIY